MWLRLKTSKFIVADVLHHTLQCQLKTAGIVKHSQHGDSKSYGAWGSFEDATTNKYNKGPEMDSAWAHLGASINDSIALQAFAMSPRFSTDHRNHTGRHNAWKFVVEQRASTWTRCRNRSRLTLWPCNRHTNLNCNLRQTSSPMTKPWA